MPWPAPWRHKWDFRTAATHYAAAVELRPDFDRALNNLGVMMMKLGDAQSSDSLFQEVGPPPS